MQYAFTKKYLIPEDPARRSNIPEPILQMISGGVAGCAIWMPPIYSLDVFKTRMQVAAPGTYSGTWDCAVKTWRCALPWYQDVMSGVTFVAPENLVITLPPASLLVGVDVSHANTSELKQQNAEQRVQIDQWAKNLARFDLLWCIPKCLMLAGLKESECFPEDLDLPCYVLPHCMGLSSSAMRRHCPF